MATIKIIITQFIDAYQPGIVEYEFIDAWKHTHVFTDKVPIVTIERLDANSHYPCESEISCEVLKEWKDVDGRIIVTISTEKPYGIESNHGLTQFDVLKHQIT